MEQGLSKDSDRTTAKHEPVPSDSKFKALTASGPVPSPGFFFFFFRKRPGKEVARGLHNRDLTKLRRQRQRQRQHRRASKQQYV